jgi:acyl-CoA synthetase (AMP-forming)/AMP-acid ligase II
MGSSYNLGDLIELVAAANPDRTAMVGGDVRYTFAEFDRRTNQVAQMLLGLGCAPGAKVAVYAWNRVEWAETFFGAFKARAIPINVNYRYVAHELEYLFDNSDSEVVVFERGFAPIVDEIRSRLDKVRDYVVIEDGTDHPTPWASSYEDLVTATSDASFDNDRSGDDLYFLYTGGTTGMPKGVMWRHEDIFPAEPHHRSTHAWRRAVGDVQHAVRRCRRGAVHRPRTRSPLGLGARGVREGHGHHARR